MAKLAALANYLSQFRKRWLSNRNVQSLSLFIKLVVVPGLLIWLVLELSGFEGSRNWQDVNFFRFASGIVAYQIALWLAAERMRTTFLVYDICVPKWPAFRIYLESIAYFFLVPMSVGIEVARYMKVKAFQPQLRFSKLGPAVLMDRVIGMLTSLGLTVVLGLFIVSSNLQAMLLGLTLVGMVGALAALILLLVFRRIREIAVELASHLMQSPMAVVPPIWTSIVMQIAMGLSIWLLATALGIEASLIEILFGVAASNLAMVIPLSLLGGGPSEAAGVLVFIGLQYSQSDAVLLVALIYGMRLLSALEGALLEFGEGGWKAFQQHKAPK